MTRRVISLNDANWRVGSVPQKQFGDVMDIADVREWLPAQVPGDVRLDLLRAGKIADPFYAMNNEESQWVDAQDWWYARDLTLDLQPNERAFLIFDGIDYQSAVFFNVASLGCHVGMFSRQIIELRSLHIKNSQLAVRVWGANALPKTELTWRQKIWKQAVKPLFSLPNEPFPDRYATLKCQMQFGWDFAPRLRTCGIWDEVQVVVVRSVFIEDARVKAASTRLQATRIEIALTLDSDHEQRVRVRCKVRAKNFSSNAANFEFSLELTRGKQLREVEFDLHDAREWNPWDRGDPNLYESEIQIFSESGELFDSIVETFGIRSFELTRSGTQQDAWTFVVNGKREFVRGANWVPLDAIPGRLRREDYAARLRQARDANVNFLRVWGGGLREKRAFYDLCDELGILVWQEFPFSGAILDRFPRGAAFLGLVDQECSAMVCALRNHPSLIVWCGGNEFSTRGNREVVETLRQLVAREDGTRPFKPASPYRDESHNWRVWHRFANLRDYKKDHTPFLSEFGLQSPPNVESLEKFLPRDALFPPTRIWEYHHAELKKLERYALPALTPVSRSMPNGRGKLGRLRLLPSLFHPYPSPPLFGGGSRLPLPEGERVRVRGDVTRLFKNLVDLQEFVSASQRAQAMAFQIAIEHMRRRKSENAAGVAIWQFNDCWPSISWSIVDYYGVPKQAYHALKRLYSPVIASFDYSLEPRHAGSEVRGDLWIVNDLRSSFANAQLTAYLNNKEIFSRRVNIAPDSAERVDAVALSLGNGENVLRLKLSWGPAPLSENEYDLNFCDEGEINPFVAMYVAIGNRLMR